jgi:hypothetical protein
LDEELRRRARDLGGFARGHPVVQRLKRLEEIIREDSELADLWSELEDFETSGGCGSGGCSGGGCGSGSAAGTESHGPVTPKGGRLDLYARFSEAPLLQEYVQVRHRFYVLVDSMIENLFESLYQKPWSGSAEVDLLSSGGVDPEVGFAGVPLVDLLPD